MKNLMFTVNFIFFIGSCYYFSFGFWFSALKNIKSYFKHALNII